MRQWLWVVAVVAFCACGVRDTAERPSFVQRDSAGVRIVESSRPSWGEGDRWRIGTDPLFIIHAWDGGAEDRPLDPTSIDIDSRGRIIVGDGKQVGWHAVLVYDSAGNFLFKAGGPGRGPGEFGQLWWASAYRGDSIVAFDMSGDQTSVFDPDGAFVRLIRLPSIQVPGPPRGTYGFTAGVDAAYGDGYLLAYPSGRLNIAGGPGPACYEHLLLRLSPTGDAWDTLGTFEIHQVYWSGTKQDTYWFQPFSVTAVTDHDLYFARGDIFEIRRYGPTGDLDRIVRRAYQPKAVSEEDRAALRAWYLSLIQSSPEVNNAMLERVRREMESAHYAETTPALSSMLMDDRGFLWVEEFRWFGRTERPPTIRPAHWSVFDSSGVWLGNVETPPGFILNAVAADRAVGFMIDDDGVKNIYAFPLDRRSETRGR